MISGKSFADTCQWVVDNRYPNRPMFHYGMAKSGDWVFINGDFLYEFVRRLTPIPVKRFYIVVHNSDRSFGQIELSKILHVAHHVYAINTTFQHPQLTTIPIGFADKDLEFLKTFQPAQIPRDIEIYSNFKIHHNRAKRGACLAETRNLPGVVSCEPTKTMAEYYNDLCRSKFVLCPEGTGIDTHRVYEAILCGATPVVLRNSLSHLYEKLPVCIVDKWTDPYYVPEGKTFSTEPTAYVKY